MGTASRKSVSLGGGRRIAALPPGHVDATSERLRHALREGAVAIEGGTRRLADPFEALAARQRLDQANARTNMLLLEAGLRFRRHWHGGQLDGLKAFDFSRESVDGGFGAQGGTAPTEAVIQHRGACRRATEAVGPRLLPFLTGIVIAAQPATALCHLVSDTAHARTAEALVVERLREALHRLVQHWGMASGARATLGVDHLARIGDA